MLNCEDGFFDWLRTIDCSEVKVYAMTPGSVRTVQYCNYYYLSMLETLHNFTFIILSHRLCFPRNRYFVSKVR